MRGADILCMFQVQAASRQEEFVAASVGDGEHFIKQLEDFAVSKGMNKPEYSVVPHMAAGKLSYSCFVKVSTDFEKQEVKVFYPSRTKAKVGSTCLYWKQF
jgi:hypothetical protein